MLSPRRSTLERSKEAFISHIEAAFIGDPIDDTEKSMSDVFRLLNNHITAGEISDVGQSLPRQPRELWPECVI